MTLYVNLAELLGERIEQGFYRPGDRLPSVRALTLEGMTPAISYEGRLERHAGRTRLIWSAEDDGRRRTLEREPGGFWRHFNAWLADVIGLEKML